MVGRICITAAMLSMIAGTVAAQAQLKLAPATPQPFGRYQIVISPFSERSTYLLDTETGTVWQLQGSSFLVGEPLIWNIMPRVDNDDDMAQLASKFGKKSAAKPTLPTPTSPTPR
jgi:hypothetical protein